MHDKGRLMPERIGLIGFGVMGAAMAPRFQAAGYRPVVFDADPGALARARAGGCEVADSPAAVGADVEIALISLPRPEHVTAVVQGEDGLLATMAAMAPTGLIVDTSTVDPHTSRANAAAAGVVGVSYLDAPVLGRPRNVGSWTLPVGGEPSAIEQATPVLRSIASSVVHVGPSGRGNTVKLMNNLMFGAINAVTCEVFALGERLGVDAGTFFDTVADSGAATVSNLFRELGPKIVAGSYELDFSVDNLEKDVGLGLELARVEGLTLGVSDAVQRLNRRAQAAGLGAQDTAAMVTVVDGTLERPAR